MLHPIKARQVIKKETPISDSALSAVVFVAVCMHYAVRKRDHAYWGSTFLKPHRNSSEPDFWRLNELTLLVGSKKKKEVEPKRTNIRLGPASNPNLEELPMRWALLAS
jgi:hypothetical protein